MTTFDSLDKSILETAERLGEMITRYKARLEERKANGEQEVAIQEPMIQCDAFMFEVEAIVDILEAKKGLDREGL